MLLAPPPRLAWSFGTSPDLSFTWAMADAFAPPARPGLMETALLAPLPPAGMEGLPPVEAPLPAPSLPSPVAILPPPAAPAPEAPITPAPKAVPPAPEAPLPLPEAPLPLIAAPGPNPFAEDPVALLEALWAARPILPDLPPFPPPPPLAWGML